LEALQRQRSVELERVVKQHKADALRRASRQREALHSSIRAQSDALRRLAARDGFFSHPFFTLDTPDSISSTRKLTLSDSAAVPWGSWAKFDFKASDSQAAEKAGFYFSWVNPYGDYAVINALTFMSATGYLTAHANWEGGLSDADSG